MLRVVEKNIILAERPRVARDPWTRARGMIGRDFLDCDALIFPGCRAVHTCFMGMALDLLFVDEARRVVAVRAEVRPWRIAMGPCGSRTVIELPAGRLCGMDVGMGDALSW